MLLKRFCVILIYNIELTQSGCRMFVNVCGSDIYIKNDGFIR